MCPLIVVEIIALVFVEESVVWNGMVWKQKLVDAV